MYFVFLLVDITPAQNMHSHPYGPNRGGGAVIGHGCHATETPVGLWACLSCLTHTRPVNQFYFFR